MKQQTETKGRNTRPVPNVARKERRRLALLKRSGLFGSNTNGTAISRACTLQDLEQAYGLVYEAYLGAGYITPNACRMRIRPFEACPETATFAAKHCNRIVGTLSAVLDSHDLGLPSDASFRRELDSLRSQGIRLCEATGEAIPPAFRRTGILTELMRCVAAQSWLEGCSIVIATVSPNHAPFYELLGCRKLADTRSYSHAVEDPVVMMALDMEELRKKDPALGACQSYTRDFLSFSNPYVRKVREWQLVARQYFYEPKLLRKLFVIESRLLEACASDEREAICRRWGDELFEEAVGVRTAELGDSPSHYVPVKAPRVNKKVITTNSTYRS